MFYPCLPLVTFMPLELNLNCYLLTFLSTRCIFGVSCQVQVTRFLIAVFSSRNRVSAPIPISCYVFPSEDIIPLSRTFRSRELPALLSSSLRRIRGFGATSPTGPRNSVPPPCLLFPHFHCLCLFPSSSCLSARTAIIRFPVIT